jgi:hypothetical protein
MEGINIGMVISVFNAVLWCMFVLATAHDKSPASETEITVAVNDTSKDCLSAFENFLAVMTAPTSTDAMVDNIRIRGKTIANSQKTQSSIFNVVDIAHFLPFMLDSPLI